MASQLGLGASRDFDKVLTSLYKKDPALAKAVDESLHNDARAKAATDAAPSAAGNSRTTPGADASAQSVPWGSVIGRDGKLDKSAYVREATSFDVQSINRSIFHGPDYQYFHKGDQR